MIEGDQIPDLEHYSGVQDVSGLTPPDENSYGVIRNQAIETILKWPTWMIQNLMNIPGSDGNSYTLEGYRRAVAAGTIERIDLYDALVERTQEPPQVLTPTQST